jgi:diguanylate cyclase (GGDEF)-like protein/PAS domain S-box-containing protein
LLIFTLDLKISEGVSISVVYLLPVLIAKRLPGIKATIITAWVCTGLITFALYYAPADDEAWQILVNLALALFVIWMAAGFNTESKRVEEELQKSHALYSQAEQIGKMGHWEWDEIADRMITCSEQFAKIFEMSVDQMLEQAKGIENKIDLLHEYDRERYIQVTKTAYERNESWDIEYRIYTKKGKEIYVHELGECVLDEQGTVIRTFGTLQDITERKQIEEQLTYQASHDALTGLVNRREFEHRTERLLSTIQLDKSEHALCFMDLDQFKVVNDTCGHTAGDEMLRQLSSVLMNSVRHRDTLARLGGDEFGVLLEHCSLDDAQRVATSLHKTVQDYQFTWQEHSFKVGVSMGLVPITLATVNFTELLKQADAACYMAKDKGRNRIHVYDTEDLEIAQRHGEIQWVTRINQTLEKDRFCLYAQPIVPLDGSSDEHYELLIRMIDKKGKIIPPGAFLPAAERYSLISKLDRWVIKNAFSLLAEHPEFLKNINFCSINFSGQSITDNDFLGFITTQLNDSGIPGEKICFEITETAAISNLSTAMKFISTLKGLRCQFALDDFGSGLSSFAYLKNLPVDYLKIDGMFVKDIVDDPIDHAMVKSINEIGQVMGMKTIAEFVENDEIKGMLREIGVDYAQGYGTGKPQPFDELLGLEYNVNDADDL